ncbi:MAG: signal peptidase I [Acidimicrobiales bacterium]
MRQRAADTRRPGDVTHLIGSTVSPRLRNAVSWIVVLLIAALIATGTRAYAVESFFVPSGSMQPTLAPGDRIIVDKLAGSVHRGDIVVFHNVAADVGGPPTLVKRVIGLPGETISGTADEIRINGRPLAEPWLPRQTGQCAEPSRAITTTHIGPNSYFVMGDCRGISDDSRYWGTVPAGNIVGKVDAVVWRRGHPWFHWF